MEIFYSKENLTPLKKSILTVGSYDGLHRGHQEILKTVVKKSKIYNRIVNDIRVLHRLDLELIA